MDAKAAKLTPLKPSEIYFNELKEARKISVTHNWGENPGSKPFSHLAQELDGFLCILKREGKKIVRKFRTANVTVFYEFEDTDGSKKRLQLVEDHEEFEGKIPERNRYLTQTVKRLRKGETFSNGAV